MLCYQADPTFKYIKPVEVKPGDFASVTEMREKRIFKSMAAVRSAERVYQKSLLAASAERRQRKHREV